MKRKKGIVLDEMKLNLLNNLQSQLTSNTWHIQMSDLARYDLFFEKFNELKNGNDYTENDIEGLFKYNLNLLSIFNKEPEELFSGNYNDVEIKYILGKNVKYNIDYILNGQIKAFSLNRLKELDNYKDRLDNYYLGLGDFVGLLSKIEVTDKMVEEIKQLKPLDFYTMSKYLANKLIPILNNKEEQLKYELNQRKNKYVELEKEKKYRQNVEKEHQFYYHIYLNRNWANVIKTDYQELNDEMLQNQTVHDYYVLEKERIISEIDSLTSAVNELSMSNYQNSEEYKNLQSSIEKLKRERELLNRHPIINWRKIKNKNQTIRSLKIKQKDNNTNYNTNKQDNINNINNKISELKIKIQYLEEQIRINQEKKSTLQKEMNNLQNKMYKFFNCYSVSEIDMILNQAESYIKNYDDTNSYYLSEIEYELEKIEKDIFIQENELNDIKEEKKAVGKF